MFIFRSELAFSETTLTRNHLSAFRRRAHYPLVIGAPKSHVTVHKIKEKTAGELEKWPFVHLILARRPRSNESGPFWKRVLTLYKGTPHLHQLCFWWSQPCCLVPCVPAAPLCESYRRRQRAALGKMEMMPGRLRLYISPPFFQNSCAHGAHCIGSDSSATSALSNQVCF